MGVCLTDKTNSVTKLNNSVTKRDRFFITLIVVLMLVTILFLSGCTGPKRESGIRTKVGRVVKIEHDVVFGGTFTDYRDDIFFADGTVLSSQGRDLSSIRINETGKFYFDKNYFEYDGRWYEFDNFKYVIYSDV